MNWISRLLPGAAGVTLDDGQRAALSRLAALPEPDAGRAHFETRYVVMSVEATSDESRDQALIAIGAIGMRQCLIGPQDAFYAPLGDAPADVLIGFLEYVAHAPLVVFNAHFNRGLLEEACERHLGQVPPLAWLDLSCLLPVLFPEHEDLPAGMDAWTGLFGIDRRDRRHGLAEAQAV
ncbi:MAG: 3'-5' exonuclease, partial [Zoogloea sp.]|nr:3'-5' exonuclease [Zoogloea sp.]